MPESNAVAVPAAPTPAAPAHENRFARLTPACLSRREKSSVIALALKVLTSRHRPRRAFAAPEDIQRFLRVKLGGRRDEVFGIVLLDTRHRLVRVVELFRGAVNAPSVRPRTVVREALNNNAAAAILYRNHPCGVAEPSEADRHIAERLGRALQLIDVRLLDHIVVTDGSFVSLAERGFI